MPDLPELYEALDDALEAMFIFVANEDTGGTERISPVIAALCAAIEVKQTQELHEIMNEEETK